MKKQVMYRSTCIYEKIFLRYREYLKEHAYENVYLNAKQIYASQQSESKF